MMKHIVYSALLLVALAIQISTVHSQYPVVIKIDPKNIRSIEEMNETELQEEQNIDYDPWWLRGHPDRDELIKNYKAWNACKYSKRPRSECDELFEILVAPAQIIIQKMKLYKDLVDICSECLDKRSQEECSHENSDKERIIHEIKTETYPWTDIYDICIADAPHSFCAGYIKILHLPENRVMEPEGLMQMMKLQICVRSGKDGEECAIDTGIQVINMEKEVTRIDVERKREGDEL